LFSIIVIILDYEPLLRIEETIVTTVFILEYAANVYVTKPARKYVLSVRGLIDALAIAPALLTWIALPQFKVFRGLRMVRYGRLLRFLRLLRLARVLKLTKDAAGDTHKTLGAIVLGVGVVIIASGRGFRESLPEAALQPLLIAGITTVVVGGGVYMLAMRRAQLQRLGQIRHGQMAPGAEPRGTLKSRFDALLHEAFADQESRLYWVVSNFILVVTLFSIIVILLDYEPLLKIEEVFVTTVFILEYAANAYVTKPTRKYVLSWRGLIDAIAIAPVLLTWAALPYVKLARGMRVVRFARVLRFLRLLRLARVLKLTKDVAGDTYKTVGVTLLGVGVVVVAICRGFRALLPEGALRPLLIVGIICVVVGDVVYILAIRRSRRERLQQG
ncbi:hypothetical protein HOK31_07540, partial [Candidatus Poribacteria bacterium]|nr:hypothetical protein [Candidatus Poribacteria bacterium]